MTTGEGLNYSADSRDLGNTPDYEEFLSVLSKIFEDLSRKLRPGKYCVTVVSDFKHGTEFHPFHSDLYQRIDRQKLQLQGITILEQGHKALYPYGYPFAYVPNVHHQYLLIFRRPLHSAKNGNGRILTPKLFPSAQASIPSNLPVAIDQFRKLPYKTGSMASRHWGHQRHEMCSFPSKMKPGLASVLVQLFTSKDSTVLDPFSGCGSIPFEAALQGRLAYGTDLSPLAAVITSAKIDPPDEIEVTKFLDRLETHLTRTSTKADLSEMEPEILEFYHERTAREIISARSFLKAATKGFQTGSVVLFVSACLAHILHGNRPYALSRRSHNVIPIPPKGPKVYKSVMRSLRDKCNRMLSLPLPTTFKKGCAMTAPADKLPIEDTAIDVVITSPSFLGTTHFLRQNRLRNWFVGWDYKKQEEVKPQFLEHQKGVEMYRPILKELNRVLKPGGLTIFHVGIVDTISMADLLAPLFLEAGFKELDRIWEHARELETHGRTDRGSTHTHGFVVAQKS